MPGFGVSFVPDQQNTNDPAKATGPQERYQQAVRVLSLRLPRFQQGGAQLAPAPLLQGAGAQGSPFGHPGVAQTQQQQSPQAMNPMLRALLQMSGMGNQAQAPMAPRVIPGLEHGTPSPAPVQQEWNQPPQPMPEAPMQNFGPITPPRTSYQDQLERKSGGQGWMDQFLRPSVL